MKIYTNYNWGCICTINQNPSTYKIYPTCQLVILEDVELVFTFFMGSNFGSSKWLVSWSNFMFMFQAPPKGRWFRSRLQEHELEPFVCDTPK